LLFFQAGRPAKVLGLVWDGRSKAFFSPNFDLRINHRRQIRIKRATKDLILLEQTKPNRLA